MIISPDPSSAPGGGSVIAQNLANSLNYSTLYFEPSIDPKKLILGYSIFSSTIFASYLPPSNVFCRIFEDVLNDFQPDVLHAHGFGHPIIHKAIKISNRKSIPTVLTVHGIAKAQSWPTPLRSALHLYHHKASGILEEAHTVTCPSESVAEEISHFSPKTPIVTPWGIDLPDLSKDSGKKPFPHIITAGRLIPLRQTDILIRSVVQIRKKWPNFSLDIVGPIVSRQYHRQLIRLINELGLANIITLKGYLPRKDLLRSLSKSHIYVSIPRQESYGLALVEAAMLGIPTIATNVGIASYLASLTGGKVLKPSLTPEDLEKALLELLGRYETTESLASSKQADLRKLFSWNDTVDSYTSVLANAANHTL